MDVAAAAAAAGPEFGLKYAINTPGFLGCSGAVAAISAYKAMLQPMGVAHIGSMAVPAPVALVTLLYCCTYIREQVRSTAGAEGADLLMGTSHTAELVLLDVLSGSTPDVQLLLPPALLRPGWEEGCKHVCVCATHS